jgi:hypothetical protein
MRNNRAEIMPEAVFGPKITDSHQDCQWDSKTCKSLHDRGLPENQCTTL